MSPLPIKSLLKNLFQKCNLENKIDQALVEVSAIANAGADEVSDIVILMFSAKTKS